jgi:hypothetical protein
MPVQVWLGSPVFLDGNDGDLFASHGDEDSSNHKPYDGVEKNWDQK